MTDNLTTFMFCLEILGASASWKLEGPSRPVVGLLYLLRCITTKEQPMTADSFIRRTFSDVPTSRMLTVKQRKIRRPLKTQQLPLL